MSRQDPVKTESTAVAQPKTPNRKKRILAVVAVGVVAVGGWYGQPYWTHGRYMVETNDAYVAADIAVISSRIQGYVAAVPVRENAVVKAGDVLVRLDDGDYRIALQIAQSRVVTAGQTLARIDAQIEAARATVVQAGAQRDVATAQLRSATTQADRVRRLASDKVVAQAQLDTAIDGLDTATASLASAEAGLANATAQIAVLQAQHAEAMGSLKELALAVDQAGRNLDLTVLRAPSDGTIANMTL